ncbi:YccF domain-containing protein [Oceanipulchritudo coccoides]|uniref:YccF domain-containing protein n=1 Tax=Oceanipulchritudo coccoides TaxID=2706888 RepID=UPI001EE878FF|nr:YccF family protein [Oceanipulchritudo coccoides]
MKGISLLLNLLWFVLGGWIMAIQWFIGGLILAITIIGLPFVPGIWRIAMFSAFPFGQELIDSPKGRGGSVFSGLLNIFWLIFAGIWIAISHALAGIVLFITIIGIPFGFAHFKLAGAALMPVGKEIVPKPLKTR